MTIGLVAGSLADPALAMFAVGASAKLAVKVTQCWSATCPMTATTASKWFVRS